MADSRRSFRKKAGAGIVAATILPRNVFGALGGNKKYVAPSDQLTRGIIGVGGIGMSNLHFASDEKCRLVAVCDVDRNHLNRALEAGKERFGTTLAAYHDFRDLIHDPNVDIVHIATPSHWHGIQAVEAARAEGDSVGGVVECFATGLPAGLGDPMFDGVENQIARALFGIPAVRGVEFGLGFAAAALRGSQHNDPFHMANGRVVTAGNNHGGALGGITSGMPLAVRVAFKPTPSIARQQRSVSLSRGEDAPLRIQGRHDPCIVPRAVPVVEAAVACVVLDMIMEV